MLSPNVIPLLPLTAFTLAPIAIWLFPLAATAELYPITTLLSPPVIASPAKAPKIVLFTPVSISLPAI